MRVICLFASALALGGCQTLQPSPVPVGNKTLAEGQVWLAQGHFRQAIEALQTTVSRHPDDAQAWRALGRAYWHAGIEAMATQAALNPAQTDLERLGQQVFELEDYLNETLPGYRLDREPDRAADTADVVHRGVGRITVVDPVWRLE